MDTINIFKVESYSHARKMALVLALVLLAIGALIQSKIYNNGFVGSNGTVMKGKIVERPPSVQRFQMDESGTLELTIKTGPHDVDSHVVQYPGVSVDVINRIEFQDKLEWYGGKSAEEMYQNELEWHRFGEESDKKKASKSLLIAQYSNKGDYSRIFELTKPINMKYAERWNHDIVFLNGQNTSRGKVNLAALVRLAWEKRDQYEQLLLLDADAAIKNFHFDITTLDLQGAMLLAQRVHGADEEHTWDIFSTVSLWNLDHLLTPRVQKAWATRFHDGDSEATLADQVKPYAETEVFTVTRQIGHDRHAYILTLQLMKHGERQIVPFEERFQRWVEKATGLCKRYRITCPKVTLNRRLEH